MTAISGTWEYRPGSRPGPHDIAQKQRHEETAKTIFASAFGGNWSGSHSCSYGIAQRQRPGSPASRRFGFSRNRTGCHSCSHGIYFNKDNDKQIRVIATEMSWPRWGPSAIPPLLTGLIKDKDESIRKAAIWGTYSNGAQGQGKAAPVFYRTTQGRKRAAVRQVAAEALRQTNAEAKGVVVPASDISSLAKCSPARMNRFDGPAAAALERIGPAAIPALQGSLTNQDTEVRQAAIRTLWCHRSTSHSRSREIA